MAWSLLAPRLMGRISRRVETDDPLALRRPGRKQTADRLRRKGSGSEVLGFKS